MIFTKATFSSNHRKGGDSDSIFGSENDTKTRKKRWWKTCVFWCPFFGAVWRISAISARFWEALGTPKSIKNTKKSIIPIFHITNINYPDFWHHRFLIFVFFLLFLVLFVGGGGLVERHSRAARPQAPPTQSPRPQRAHASRERTSRILARGAASEF